MSAAGELPREHPWLTGVLAQIGDRMFLTVAEVADLMRTDPRTIRRGIDARTIPAVHVSEATIRIPVPAFLELLGLPQTESEAPATTDATATTSTPHQENDHVPPAYAHPRLRSIDFPDDPSAA